MSAEAWAATILVVAVALFLVALFWLMRRHMQDQRQVDGGRRYEELEKTDWFRDPDRLERIRQTVAQEDQRTGPPPPAPDRPAKDLYGDRVRGGEDG